MWVEGNAISIYVGDKKIMMNVFHLTWYPGKPLRGINREWLGKCLGQDWGHLVMHFDCSKFRSWWPEYPEMKNKRSGVSFDA